MQRVGPGRRAKHLGGADDVGSTVEQDRSHLAEQIEYDKNVADLLTKLESYNSFSNINQNYWDQKLATVERLPVFDDRENESFDDDVHSIVDTTSHLTTAVLRRCDEHPITTILTQTAP